jgi:hypothetical protein
MAGGKLMAGSAGSKLMARSKAVRDMATGRMSRAGRPGPDPVGIYLNDHLAGATAGGELAWRSAAAANGTPAAGDLRRIAAEITQDRAALLRIMAALGIGVRHYKVYAAWVGEKAGRLKFNGHLVSRSPLSDLEELEFLLLGVEGKAAGWRMLRTLADYDPRLDQGQLDELIARARRQSGTLEILRVRAAAAVIAARKPAAQDAAQQGMRR